jgi:glutamine cyclotransferase
MTALKKLSRFYWVALFLAACNNDRPAENTTPKTEVVSNELIPKVIPYDIVKEYPHDPKAFTEGLEYGDGFLYESSGEYGVSDVRKVELATGKPVVIQKMGPKYFGEGLTILNGKIYQLTYKEGKGFVYNGKTLKQQQTFAFKAPEGWGMTNNGKQLIFDDGTDVLHFIDPATFSEVKTLKVTDEHGPVTEINELEMINGFIYANKWQTELILKIDTATGRVVGRADLGTLRERAGIPPMSGIKGAPEVLNGIAYDARGNRIFITGKFWPKVFEVKLDN